jgi:transcriptional regulator with XRE-family HTH domain
MSKKKMAPPGLPMDQLLRERFKDPEARHRFEREKMRLEMAEIVRRLREEAGLSQQELAEKLEVAQPMVARIENGREERLPTCDTLMRIAAATGKQLILSFVEEDTPVGRLVRLDSATRRGARSVPPVRQRPSRRHASWKRK